MEAHYNTSLTLPCSIIAIGAFDGVHQGHQTVIKQAIERSKMLNAPSLVYTFDPPPRVYFQGAQTLTTIEEKIAKFEKLRVDHVMIARFDQLYAKRSAYDFIDHLAKLNPLEIMVGGDFRFGKDRKGDIKLLEKYFNVQVTQPVCCSKGNPISSTRIRQLISKGEINLSNSLLGWPLGE